MRKSRVMYFYTLYKIVNIDFSFRNILQISVIKILNVYSVQKDKNRSYICENKTHKNKVIKIEDAVKNIGGKTSQELGRRRPMMQQERAEFVASMEERQNRMLREELRKEIWSAAFSISIAICSRTRFGESEVGEVIAATLGGLLSIPAIVLSAPLRYIGNITSREVRQRVVGSISESTAGLSGALAGSTLMLISRIVRSIAGTNMEFGESLRSGLMTTTAAAIGTGTGAALSTALMRRAFAPVSTNLEDVATAQSDIQEQSIQ